MSTETTRLIRDREKWGKGVWRWGKKEIIYLREMLGKGVWRWREEGDYIPIATLSPPE